MYNKKFYFHAFLIVCVMSTWLWSGPIEAVDSLAKRVIPAAASSFSYEIIPADGGSDVFELDNAGGSIVIRGNNANSLARGLNYYLKYYCNVHFSLTGNQVDLPSPLPAVLTVHIKSPYTWRYMLNYCTYNYTMSFWNWDKWESYIDWMALSGINLALAGVFGQAGVWQNTLRRMEYSDSEILEFIPGPAWDAWWLMGNLEGWGGPIPQSLIDARVTLGRKIIDRMRQLGVEPVMQGFYGMVPNSLINKFPSNRIYATGTWCGFTRPAMIDPSDPLFETISDIWYEEQTNLFGDAQYFGGDPFHEGGSANINLTVAATGIQQGMFRANPDAVWVLQAWQNNPSSDLLNGTIAANTLILDLLGSSWTGYPWVWNTLWHDGGKEGLFGPLSILVNGPFDNSNSNMAGIGAMPEGIGTNVVTWDLLFDMGWLTSAPDLKTWLTNYANRRYGKASANLQNAWHILSQGVYKQSASGTIPETILCARPAASFTKVSFWGTVSRNYSNNDLINAWELLFVDTAVFTGIKTYEHDLVDFTRQLLANHAMTLHSEMMAAYSANNKAEFTLKSEAFLELILDQDTLLSTSPAFLLGRWIQDARNMGTTAVEQDWYEWCARTLITTWGPRPASEGFGGNGGLHEYSHREWSGILRTLYYDRWKRYINDLSYRLDGGNGQNFDWFAIDSAWCRQTSSFDRVPQDNAIEVVRRIAAKYNNFKPDPSVYGIAVGKPVAATSAEDDSPPGSITDGSTTGCYWGAGPVPQSVTIDLLSVARIDSIRVFPYSLDTRYYQYTVSISDDNSNWTTVGDFSTNTQPATALGTLSVLSPSRDARFVKVTMTFNSANPSVHLNEVSVFGEFVVNTIPTKNTSPRQMAPFLVTMGRRGLCLLVRGKGHNAITIYSIDGKVLKRFRGEGTTTYSLPRGSISSGVYIIVMEAARFHQVRRIAITF